MTPSAPVFSRTAWAFSGVVISPLAITGMRAMAFTAAIVSNSASPRYCWQRVRPCMASARIPLSSAIRRMLGAFLFSTFQPVRILSVTGVSGTAFTTAVKIWPTRVSCWSRAEPAMTLHTFLAGQPMLISMIWAPRSALYFAASAIMAGSAPAICTEIGATSPS